MKINGKSALLRSGLSNACLRSDVNVAEVRDVLIMPLCKGDIDPDIAFTMLVGIGSSWLILLAALDRGFSTWSMVTGWNFVRVRLVDGVCSMNSSWVY